MNNKYKHFGLVGLDGKIQCELSYNDGIGHYNNIKNCNNDRIKRGLKAKSSWDLAHASETALKSFLIYTDLIRMPYFTQTSEIKDVSHFNKEGQPVTSYYPKMDGENESIWRLLLDGRRDELSIKEQSKYTDPKFGMIGKPSVLLSEIKKSILPGDFRGDPNYMIIDPIHSYDFKKTISGHDLFAYLKLQAPEIQVIINNELFLQGENISKDEKIIGILLGYSNNINQNTDNLNNIFSNSLAFPKRRFDWITGTEISDYDLKIIKDFSETNKNILDFKFPNEDLLRYIYEQDYSCFNNTIFTLLDPVGKYYIKKHFNNDEINSIIKIAEFNNLNQSDALSFVTMCVYYKYYIKEILQDKSSILNFNQEKIVNIYNHTCNMKKYDSNGTAKLEDSSIFINHISEIKEVKRVIQNKLTNDDLSFQSKDPSDPYRNVIENSMREKIIENVNLRYNNNDDLTKLKSNGELEKIITERINYYTQMVDKILRSDDILSDPYRKEWYLFFADGMHDETIEFEIENEKLKKEIIKGLEDPNIGAYALLKKETLKSYLEDLPKEKAEKIFNEYNILKKKINDKNMTDESNDLTFLDIEVQSTIDENKDSNSRFKR